MSRRQRTRLWACLSSLITRNVSKAPQKQPMTPQKCPRIGCVCRRCSTVGGCGCEEGVAFALLSMTTVINAIHLLYAQFISDGANHPTACLLMQHHPHLHRPPEAQTSVRFSCIHTHASNKPLRWLQGIQIQLNSIRINRFIRCALIDAVCGCISIARCLMTSE